jgi:hypothetical protein
MKLGRKPRFLTAVGYRKELDMTPLKVAAFFEEFKFLKKCVSDETVKNVKVQRVGEDLMNAKPEKRHWAGVMDYDTEWDRILLFGEDGQLLAGVGVRTVQPKWYRPSTWSGATHFEQTVGEALLKFPETHFIAWIVGISHDVTVYKPPKGYTVAAWIGAELKRERADLQDEIKEIDAI